MPTRASNRAAGAKAATSTPPKNRTANLSPASPIASASPQARRFKKHTATGTSGTSHGGAASTAGAKPRRGTRGRTQAPPEQKDQDSKKKTLFSPTYDDEASTTAAPKPKPKRGGKAAVKVKKAAPVKAPEVKANDNQQPQYEEEEFDPFLFIKHLPPLTQEMINRVSPLPRKSPTAPRISLALDLDETLVHCSVEPLSDAELTFTVTFNGVDYEVYVRTRPYLKEFLQQVSQWFEIIVFTASQQVYADKLLDILDPKREYIQHRVFRDSCVCVDGNYLKDLNILGRDLKTTAIVDNSVQAFGFQLDNGIPIESWFDDDRDRELLSLLDFLKQLKDVDSDVRPLIKDTFKLQDYVNSLR